MQQRLFLSTTIEKLKPATFSPSRNSSLVLYSSHTYYDVVKKAASQLGFELSYDSSDDWDLYWTDSSPHYDITKSLKPHQKVNFIPGIICISLKNCLSDNLNRMKALYPSAYDFFP